jgi:N-acyl-D-aspartate/D-glutamate deacylase
MMGLGDGGAHVGTICDASFPTWLLSHWSRDTKTFSTEQAIRMLTNVPAAWMGFADRGVLARGKVGDLNVIEMDALSLGRPRLVHDLPAGGKRFLQEATGYRATVVSGEVVRSQGRTTEARPGRVVRG